MLPAALVNLTTTIVESVLMVSPHDPAPEGYALVPLALVPRPRQPEEQEVLDLLMQIDPSYVPTDTQWALPVVHPGVTTWTPEHGLSPE